MPWHSRSHVKSRQNRLEGLNAAGSSVAHIISKPRYRRPIIRQNSLQSEFRHGVLAAAGSPKPVLQISSTGSRLSCRQKVKEKKTLNEINVTAIHTPSFFFLFVFVFVFALLNFIYDNLR